MKLRPALNTGSYEPAMGTVTPGTGRSPGDEIPLQSGIHQDALAEALPHDGTLQAFAGAAKRRLLPAKPP